MNTVKIEQKNRTLMVAHRGLSKIEPENTVASFIAAGNRSYWGIETDVWRTADGKFILIHDGNPKRMSGMDCSVEEVDLEALRSIPLLDKDGVTRRSDLRLPTLKEYIRICKKYEKICVLELKSLFTEEELRRIIGELEEEDALKTTVFIAFDRRNMLNVRKLLPGHPCQQLSNTVDEDLFQFVCENQLDVDLYSKCLTEEWVRRFHSAGIQVNCWTVNEEEKAKELISWGVDYLTTNILE